MNLRSGVKLYYVKFIYSVFSRKYFRFPDDENMTVNITTLVFLNGHFSLVMQHVYAEISI